MWRKPCSIPPAPMLSASCHRRGVRRERARRDAHDRAQLARQLGFHPQRQWWPTWPTSNEPAAAALGASAAYGIGQLVLHVENGILTIFNLLCETSAAILNWQNNRRQQTSCAAAAVLLAEWHAWAPARAAAGGGTAVVVLLVRGRVTWHVSKNTTYTPIFFAGIVI